MFSAYYCYHWPKPHEGNNNMWIGNHWESTTGQNYEIQGGIWSDCFNAFAATLIAQTYWSSQYVIMICCRKEMDQI